MCLQKHARQLVMMVKMCLCALQCVWLILCAKKQNKKRSPIVTRVFCVHFVLRADPVPDRK